MGGGLGGGDDELVADVVLLELGPPARAVDVDDGQRVGRAVGVEHHGRLVAVLAQVQLQAVAVLGRVRAVLAPVRSMCGVNYGMVERGLCPRAYNSTDRLRE